MKEKIEQLIKRRERPLEMGGPEKAARQHKQGKLTARERIYLRPKLSDFLKPQRTQRIIS